VEVTATEDVSVYVYLDKDAREIGKSVGGPPSKFTLKTGKAIAETENAKSVLIEVDIPKREIFSVFILNMNKQDSTNITMTVDDM